MKVLKHHSEFDSQSNVSTLVIGNFDGVHVGHRALLDFARAQPPVVVMSFDPHPRAVLNPSRTYQRIRPTSYFIENCRELKIDVLLVQEFTREFSQWPARRFCEEIVSGTFQPKRVLVGPNFRFGQNRSGDVNFMAEFCKNAGIRFETVNPILAGDQWVSTSRIKGLISLGEIEEANRLLVEPFFIEQSVVHGDAKGKSLGFATANLEIGNYVVPRLGVYACQVSGEDLKNSPAIVNVGIRPTLFSDLVPRVEVHLLDFSGDLYGHRLKVEFLKFLRDEKKFANFVELQEQIGKDIQVALSFFSSR